MMQIEILTVGRLKKESGYLQTGIEEYLKRLTPYAKVRIIEVSDETITSTKTRDQVLEVEGRRILAYLEKASYCIALSERGALLTSEQFATEWGKRMESIGNPLNGGIGTPRTGPMMMVVGGALGLSQTIIHRADWVLSLSPMTYPHQLVRLVLLEQLYRAFKILRNEPYHK
jgi:23S rRNA (pseudouridine1915-N3)-methyltransferase